MLTNSLATVRVVNGAARAFVGFSVLSLLLVSGMAIFSPQAVMDLVAVHLPNPDAYSSIRGVYGGVGLTICLHLLYLGRYHLTQALVFLVMLWGFYALSRLTTSLLEGPLGAFGTQWLQIETTLALLAGGLLWLRRRHG